MGFLCKYMPTYVTSNAFFFLKRIHKSMYRFLLDIPKYEYDSFVENSEYCNLLQSYDWAKIKSNWQHIHVITA